MRLLHVLAVLLCAQAVALADLKVSRKMGAGGYGGGESTVYIKGQRQRTEMPGIISIQQCDLRRTIQINDQTKKYLIMPDDAGQPEASAPAAAAPQGPTQTRRGAVVTVTESIVDTGERKQMFGYTARHIKTKNVIDAPPEACNPGHMETESDGWYIDLAAGFSCDTDRPPTPPARRARPDCVDQYRTRRTGTGKLGFPVMVTYKSGGGEMGGGFASTLEVTDISTVTLDPSLFDIPAGYTQAASFQELMGMPGGMMGIPGMTGETPGARPPSDTGGGVSSAAPSVGPKQPGTIRVGVAAINNPAGGAVPLDELRSRLVGSISGSGIEAVPLDAAQAPAAEAEAKQKDCDLVLYTDLSALKQSGGKFGGMLGRATGIGGSDRYESRVDFKLFAVGGASQLESNATAKEDGGAEASVGSALDKEAKAVVAAARKKK
jgi:hypothetical protein